MSRAQSSSSMHWQTDFILTQGPVAFVQPDSTWLNTKPKQLEYCRGLQHGQGPVAFVHALNDRFYIDTGPSRLRPDRQYLIQCKTKATRILWRVATWAAGITWRHHGMETLSALMSTLWMGTITAHGRLKTAKHAVHITRFAMTPHFITTRVT